MSKKNEVNRYSENSCEGLDQNGPWVKYSDYQILQNKLEEKEKELNAYKIRLDVVEHHDIDIGYLKKDIHTLVEIIKGFKKYVSHWLDCPMSEFEEGMGFRCTCGLNELIGKKDV